MEPISSLENLITLELLPLDIQKKIVLSLTYDDLISFFKVSKKLNKIEKDIYFWMDYFKTNVPDQINVPSRVNINWYKNRLRAYPDVKKLINLIFEEKIETEYIQKFHKGWTILEIIENLVSIRYKTNQLISLGSLSFGSHLLSNLRELCCSNCNLTSLGFSEFKISLPNLKILYCKYNQLTFIPHLPKLEELSCGNNKLTSLGPLESGLPYFPELRELYCENNNLTSLSSFPKLQVLICDGNKLVCLSLLFELKEFHFCSNSLTSLSPLPELRSLYCKNNRLTYLPLLPNLIQLYCPNNRLTCLPSLSKLQNINCENNPLPGFTLKYWKNIWKKNNN
jgi:hypothetical protein